MQIRGKEYIEVKDRVLTFNKDYPTGFITTEIVQQDEKLITMRATVIPDVKVPERKFTGTAQEWKDDPKSMVNKTSFVENCETSAVGRALALMGIGVVDSIASAEEVMIAKNKEIRERVKLAEEVYEKAKEPEIITKGISKPVVVDFKPKVYEVKNAVPVSE